LWNEGDRDMPTDRPLLLIATAKGMPVVDVPPELVVAKLGLNGEFIPVEIPYDGHSPPELRVQWWTEIPLPPGFDADK
jgi:hypothetical protein